MDAPFVAVLAAATHCRLPSHVSQVLDQGEQADGGRHVETCEGRELVGITVVISIKEVELIIIESPGSRREMPQRWATSGHAMATVCNANKIFLSLLLCRKLDECTFLPNSHFDAL